VGTGRAFRRWRDGRDAIDQQQQSATEWFDQATFSSIRDFSVMSYLGAGTFIVGIIGLIVGRKRSGSQTGDLLHTGRHRPASRAKALDALRRWAQAESLELVTARRRSFRALWCSGKGYQFFSGDRS